MARPTPTTAVQEELYTSLAAWADQDSANNWDLLQFCGAIAAMLDQIELYARDTADGRPGWSILLDPDRCPSEALPWLAQFVGVDILPGLTDAQQRARIKGLGGFKRGTVASMVAAARQYLSSPTAPVIIKERDGGAYNLTIITYVADTPDSAAVLRALNSQKPAGILLTYQTVAGITYVVLRASYTDYTAVRTAFLTYSGLRNNVPGT